MQEFCLEINLYNQEVKVIEKRTEDFEQQLMIHRPEVYEKYTKEKEEREELGYDHIVWKTPESPEEAELILGAIQRSNEILQEQSGQEVQDEVWEEGINDSPEINFLKQFEGIDLSQLRDIEE